MKSFPLQLLLLLAIAGPGGADAADPSLPRDHAARMKAGTELFRRTIRPALEEHCLRCHGGEKTRAGFDLTSRESLLRGGESGSVIDLGQPEASFLLAVVRHEEEPTMPPKKPQLPAPLLADLATWIALGAPYDQPLLEKDGAGDAEMRVTDTDREFWSFRPLADPVPPPPVNDWAQTDIDRFILARMTAEGLEPNPPADPGALVRRTYLDLIGLPPTPAQMDAALAMGHAALVDQLLDSPHHGERWARHWLDAARFGESHGFEQDYNREHAYHYRDFVIRALNADMPWDQFVRWQLAGDEIAPDDPLAMMATGFLGAGVFPTQLTEKEFESARYDELDDMAATTGTAMLGLTIGCARCHDHKFDPIPVKDYYRFIATFTTTIRSEVEVDLDPAGFRQALSDWEKAHAAVTGALAEYENSEGVRKRFDQWLASDAPALSTDPTWAVLEPAEMSSEGGATLTRQTDGSVLVTGTNADAEKLAFTSRVEGSGIRHLRIEALSDASLPRKGPGRAGNGNFALSDLKVTARPANDPKAKGREIPLISPRATHQQNAGSLSVASAIDPDPRGTGWAVDGQIGKDQAAVFTFAEPVEFEGGTLLTVELIFNNNRQHAIGRPRLSVSPAPDPPVAVGGGQPAALTAAFGALEAGKLLPEHRAALFPRFARDDDRWRALDTAVRASMAKKPTPNLATVQVSSEGFPPTKHHADGRGFPHFYPETHFLDRGDPNQKQGVATPGFLQVLMRGDRTSEDWRVTPPETWKRTSYRRTALANWITDTEHGAGHLLARVAANRVWHHHFGRGLVATPNDFGLQGSLPSHPELLDFLARRLIASGWSLKALHREILLSAAWRQDSATSAAKAAIDPENRWLWRYTPRRLEAEIVRDSLLAVTGQLDPTRFGPGTLDEGMTRRSLYFTVKRSRLIPMMQIFDQPEPLASQGSRPSTTIAPQALLFMNNPEVVKWARAMAAEIDDDDPGVAVHALYARALGRAPTAAELAENRAFLEAQSASYPSPDARQLALADLCQVVFSLNEFIYLP